MLIEDKILVDHVLVAIELFSEHKKYGVLLVVSKKNQFGERKFVFRIKVLVKGQDFYVCPKRNSCFVKLQDG